MLYKIEAFEDKGEFTTIVEEYKTGYNKKFGRRLPRNTILIRSIYLEYDLEKKYLQEYIAIHENIIGGKCLKSETTQNGITLIWFWANQTEYRVCNLKRGDLHKLRKEVSSFLSSKKSFLQKVFSKDVGR